MKLVARKDLEDGVYYDVSVWVKGVKRRCRKVTRERLELGHIPFTAEVDGSAIETLTELAKREVNTHMKSHTGLMQLNLNKIEVANEGGFQSYKMQLFDEAHKKYHFEMPIEPACAQSH